jgi:hypothetical protein
MMNEVEEITSRIITENTPRLRYSVGIEPICSKRNVTSLTIIELVVGTIPWEVFIFYGVFLVGEQVFNNCTLMFKTVQL